MITLQTVNS